MFKCSPQAYFCSKLGSGWFSSASLSVFPHSILSGDCGLRAAGSAPHSPSPRTQNCNLIYALFNCWLIRLLFLQVRQWRSPVGVNRWFSFLQRGGVCVSDTLAFLEWKIAANYCFFFFSPSPPWPVLPVDGILSTPHAAHRFSESHTQILCAKCVWIWKVLFQFLSVH